MARSIIIAVVIIVILIGAGFLIWPRRSTAPAPAKPLTVPAYTSLTLAPEKSDLTEPVPNFKTRITKKPFGLFVEPNNSPVQPEKFLGYHTGVDVEYGEVKEEVSVKAIAAGKIIDATTAQDYGGVVAIQHKINSQPIVAIYGHLDPAALPDAGASVQAGDVIGRLGVGFTPETDGERKHLHFGLYKGSTLNLRGYVQNKNELNNWLDPLTIF